MRPSLFLCLTFLFIYTCFLYIQDKSFTKQIFCGYSSGISQDILIGVECFTILFGGIVAAFIIVPSILFSLSLICLVIGVVMFELHTYLISEENETTLVKCVILYYTGIVLFGIFYGLFRFIILVMMLNQRESKSIKRRSQEWFIVLNICYIIVWIFLPLPLKDNNYIALCIPMIIIGAGLLIIGKGKKYYVFYSEPIKIRNVLNIIKKFLPVSKANDRRKMSRLETNQILHTMDSVEEESKKVLLALSKSIMIFILCIPFGICDSQNRYAYMYQSNHMRQPMVNWYFDGRSNIWPTFFSSMTVICFIIILWILKKFSPKLYYKIYPKNIKYRIIFGNILMIVSTLLNGGLETIRLQVFWGWNSTTTIPSKSFNQIIDGQTFKAADLSVFFMLPPIVILGLSEVYFLLSGIEIMDMVSMKNMKYLSISLMMAAIGNGGLSDFFFIIIELFNIFDPEDLNKRLPDNTGYCCGYESRLDYILYGLAAVAFLSLVISMILMKRFSTVFVKDQLECETQV